MSCNPAHAQMLAEQSTVMSTAEHWLAMFRSWLDQPLEQVFLTHARGLGYVEAALAVAVGIVYLLYGLKVFRVLVVVNAAAAGAVGGLLLYQHTALDWWVIPAGAAVLAVLAWPMMRIAVVIMAVLAGAAVGLMVAHGFRLDQAMTIASAFIGAISLGLLAFVVFRQIVIAFTSVQGAGMTAAGMAAIIVKFDATSGPLADALTQRPFLLPVLVLTPAAVGFIYQATRKQADRRA